VAFYSDRDGVARVWLWERATGQLRKASDAQVRVFMPYELPAWTPDSRTIVTKLLPEHASADSLPVHHGASGASDSSDALYPGSAVTVYSAHAEAAAGAAPAAAAVAHPPATTPDSVPVVDTTAPGAAPPTDIAAIDVATGAVRRIGSASTSSLWASPDGKSVMAFGWRGMLRHTQQFVYDLILFPLSGGPRRVLAHDVAQMFPVAASWSPDGRQVAYFTAGQRASHDVYVVDVASNAQPRLLTPGKHAKFGGDYSWPMWTPSGDAVLVVGDTKLWKISTGGAVTRLASDISSDIEAIVGGAHPHTAWGDGRMVYVTTRDQATQQVGIFAVDLTSGRATKIREENANYGNIFQISSASADGRSIVYLREDAQHAPDAWIAGPGFANARRLTHAYPAYDSVTFGAGRVIEYRSTDGQVLHGALILPSDYQAGKRYPLLVRLYPGPYKHAGRVNRFGLESADAVFNMQILATRGYAILFPETPQRLGSPMRDIMSGAMPAVNKVIEMGIADPDRLGVFGHSYGGYATLATIVQTNRFKAAVASAGPGDLLSGYGELSPNGATFGVGWSETGQGLLGVPPWENLPRYAENSPITYLNRVTTPLLIVHGADDQTVPAWQTDAVFVGLRRLGKEVAYRKYAGEDHVLQGYENIADQWLSTIAWFDRYLK
jgi:dipeptidyl aminopeptidase/acylaminoacyl peptidase